MDRRRLFIALLWPTALVVLVGVLAFFQYRWLGQVSEADRDRQRTTLNQRAREFAADFDREISRVFIAMQFDQAADAESTEAFAKRYVEWKESAAFPQLVRSVYLTSETPAEDAPIRLARFDPATRGFVADEWPASLAPVRERLNTMRHRFTAPVSPFSSAGNATFKFVAVQQSPVMSAVPALVIPTQSVQHFTSAQTREVIRFDVESRYVIVEFDKQVLTDVVLPALVEKHLAVDDYRVEVLETRAGRDPIPVFRKGLPAAADLDAATADASTPFFSVRVENARDALMLMRAMPSMGTVPLASEAGAGRMSIVVQNNAKIVQKDLDAFATAERMGVEAALQAKAAGAGARGGSAATSASFSYGPGAWQLVLQHPAGSLEAAVVKARRRNLAISFGVLAVLSVGVFLISINAQRAQRLAAQQMDFVATVSHELRTPLAVIRSAAQNLSAGVVHEPSQARQYGELIDAEGRRLTDMVEQVLSYAGLSDATRSATTAPTDVAWLTKDVVASCDSLIRDAGFAVDVTIADNIPDIALDEAAFRRALNNLIVNALKYGTNGAWIGVDVSVGAGRNGHQEVRVAVSDRGRGIDTADLPHIFDAFYRGQYAKDRQIHGNGLGLSLVRGIAKAHGGHVTVASTPGAGATFTLHLPV